jgi:hypothetical protein
MYGKGEDSEEHSDVLRQGFLVAAPEELRIRVSGKEAFSNRAGHASSPLTLRYLSQYRHFTNNSAVTRYHYWSCGYRLRSTMNLLRLVCSILFLASFSPAISQGVLKVDWDCSLIAYWTKHGLDVTSKGDLQKFYLSPRGVGFALDGTLSRDTHWRIWISSFHLKNPFS